MLEAQIKCGCGWEGPVVAQINGQTYPVEHSCIGYLIRRIEKLEAALTAQTHQKNHLDKSSA